MILTIFDSCICQMRKFYQWISHQMLERRTHSEFTKLNSLLWTWREVVAIIINPRTDWHQLDKPPRDGTLFKLTPLSALCAEINRWPMLEATTSYLLRHNILYILKADSCMYRMITFKGPTKYRCKTSIYYNSGFGIISKAFLLIITHGWLKYHSTYSSHPRLWIHKPSA